MDSDNYGKFLVPVLKLRRKFSSHMRSLFARKFGKVYNLDEMLEIFRCELEAKEQASLTIKAENGSGKSREHYTTGAFYCASKLVIIKPSAVIQYQIQGATINLAYFGKAIIHHFAVLKLIRKDLIFKNTLCFICLDDSHIASKCTSSYSCKKSKGRHNILISAKDFKNHYQNNN